MRGRTAAVPALSMFLAASLAVAGCGASRTLPGATGGTAASATQTAFSIAAPGNGATVSTETITVSGVGPAGEPIVRDIPMAPDDKATVGSDGRWSLDVTLDQGSNDLIFRVGDDKSTAISLNVIYAPQASLRLARRLLSTGHLRPPSRPPCRRRPQCRPPSSS